MVASTVKGQIDLSTLSVTGKATPAVKGGAAGAVIPAPAIAGVLTVVPPPSASEPLVNRKPATQKPAARVPAAAVEAPAEKPARRVPAVELHGGSVPAPEQKVPGQ